MIQLGSFDANVSAHAREAYAEEVEDITGLPVAQVGLTSEKLVFRQNTTDQDQPMTVAAVQQALKSAGFFPGTRVDGICGYRTLSAMRLFQEYVRSYEKLACVPDGLFGRLSQAHLKRWSDKGIVARWTPSVGNWQAGTLEGSEYAQWLTLLQKVKERETAAPSAMLEMVNSYPHPSDTRSVVRWDFGSAGDVHLIGIRRNEKSGKFDDIFVLLIKGLVFKFQGSTEPGASKNAAGAPFLVQGQHDYRFGWHRSQYLALRPRYHGVLVVRSRGDLRLDDPDLNNGLERNTTINIHWGGKGMKFDVSNWSEGCQVINGTLYMNEANELTDCSTFAAVNNEEIQRDRTKTRAAFNVLVDLVSALASDLPPEALKYTLLIEKDLELSKPLAEVLAQARAEVGERLNPSSAKGNAPSASSGSSRTSISVTAEREISPRPLDTRPTSGRAETTIVALDWQKLATVFSEADHDYLKEVAEELNRDLVKYGLRRA